MLQQLLITLPTEASTWVKLHHPEKAKEGAPLWEDVTKMFEGGGESRLMDGGMEEEEDRRQGDITPTKIWKLKNRCVIGN